MIVLKNRKIAKSGASHYITIPKTYIRGELVNPKKRYHITLEEVKPQ